MKKITFFLVALCVVTSIYGQIEVGSNNNVGIGITGTVNSKFSVNHIGSTSWTGYFYNPSTTVTGGALIGNHAAPTRSGLWCRGVYGICSVGKGYSVGVAGTARSSTVLTTGMAFGVMGYAGNATSGYNYAVFGQLDGTNNGTGIFGTTQGVCQVDGKYAGYFYGDVKVSGTLYATLSTTSDRNSKKDIKVLDSDNLNKIKQLNAIKFKYKMPKEMQPQLRTATASTDTLSSKDFSPEMEEYYSKERIGLVAQEIQEVYPELVSKDPSGMLAVDYTGMIPVLLAAIKEQQAEIEEMKAEIMILKRGGNIKH